MVNWNFGSYYFRLLNGYICQKLVFVQCNGLMNTIQRNQNLKPTLNIILHHSKSSLYFLKTTVYSGLHFMNKRIRFIDTEESDD